MIRRVPVRGAGGFRSEEFRAASRASPAIMFICPYGTSISTLRWAVRRLRREGYHVVAYETATAVFMVGDPAILRDLIRRCYSRTALGRVQHGRRHCPGHVAAGRGPAAARPARLVAAPARSGMGRSPVAAVRTSRWLSLRLRQLTARHDSAAGQHRAVPGADAAGWRPGQRARGTRHRPSHDDSRRLVASAADHPDGAARLACAGARPACLPRIMTRPWSGRRSARRRSPGRPWPATVAR